MQHEELVGSSVAARYLGCSRSTVRRWAETDRLPHVVMPSGQFRYRIADLEAATRYVPGIAKAARADRLQEADDE